MSKKATLDSLETLHDLVAKTLSSNLDDPKVLAQAITFLKNNNITVDLMESKPMQNVFEAVNNMVTPLGNKDKGDKDAIDLLLEDIG